MNANDLCDALLDLPELTLRGSALMESSTGTFPVDVPRETLRKAVIEIVDYTDACRATAQRMANLTPIPLAVGIPEYAL